MTHIFNPYTEEEALAASEEWGFNCGPGALCAVLNLKPDQLRPHLLDFEEKGYTNPTLMFRILQGFGLYLKKRDYLPRFGLARIQWHGPWMRPGVPIGARYRQTHWIATAVKSDGTRGVFDVNTGFWCPYDKWETQVVPFITTQIPRADGKWSVTHGIELPFDVAERAKVVIE